MAEETQVLEDVKQESLDKEQTAPAKKKKKKSRRLVPHGQVHVLATFNNTVVTVTDTKGNSLVNASAGSCGFQGSKKSTAYAAQVAAERAITGAKQAFGVNKVDVYVKGVGLGRDAAIRTLAAQNVEIDNIRDVTPVPHGGTRPRLPKRN